MHYFIKTKKEPSTIEFLINLKWVKELTVIGFDSKKNETTYFFRQIVKDGVYFLNLPQSPGQLIISFLEKINGQLVESENYELIKLECYDLEQKVLILDDYAIEFIKFAQEFSEKSSYLKPSDYFSDDENFMIRLKAKIHEDLKTPSRIHKSGVIEVSKEWFDNMTVPGRMSILLHEFAHRNLEEPELQGEDNLVIEKEADENALQIYLGIGYPKIEWINAWTQVFEDYDDHFSRLDSGNYMLRTNN